MENYLNKKLNIRVFVVERMLDLLGSFQGIIQNTSSPQDLLTDQTRSNQFRSIISIPKK
jgi:hypothetical protein